MVGEEYEMKRLSFILFFLAAVILLAQDKDQADDFLRLAEAKGGGADTEKAVELALEWLARH